MRAHILVNARPGKVREIARQILDISGVKMANFYWYVPDIFVVAEAANANELNKLVIDRFNPWRAWNGPRRTLPLTSQIAEFARVTSRNLSRI